MTDPYKPTSFRRDYTPHDQNYTTTSIKALYKI